MFGKSRNKEVVLVFKTPLEFIMPDPICIGSVNNKILCK